MATKPPDKKPQSDLQQVVDPIKNANNVLVTINNNPTVDQLAACIGLTLVLNKLGKHATAVFSGQVPSTLEFLKPEETFEKNTDSLRDFIIALDKSKADKLRYKVEDDVVKIFITPYKTSISEKDLGFSQGDFNVDVVVALGVEEKKNLDEAILSHGRILHDATVISINTQGAGHIGSVNWSSKEASSLCEMVADVVQSLSNDVLDTQNSTALLTGIVAETERYSNEKAKPHTMSIAANLMSAGASTQLVSNELDSALKSQTLPSISGDSLEEGSGSNDGVLDIDHSKEDDKTQDKEDSDKPAEKQKSSEEETQPSASEEETTTEKVADEYLDHLNLSEDPHDSSPDSSGKKPQEPDKQNPPPPDQATSRLIKDPPHFTGQLTANSVPEERQYTGSTDPLSNMPNSSLVGQQGNDEDTKNDAANTANSLQQKVDQTLKEIEESVSSPHLSQEEGQQSDADTKSSDKGQQQAPPKKDPPQLSVDEARKAAETAAAGEERPKPRQDRGTTDMNSGFNRTPSPESYSTNPDADKDDDLYDSTSSSSSSNPPPPAPPPITPSS